MLTFIDSYLKKLSIYQLTLYVLIFLVIGAFALSLFDLLPYSPIAILFSTLFIASICLLANELFVWAFDAKSKMESVLITALILVLIINPIASVRDFNFFSLAFWSSVLAMGSKYILAINKKHIFNPAAIAVVLTSMFLNQSASWWVGTLYMLPFVLIGGLLIVRKTFRPSFIWICIAIATVLVTASHFSSTSDFFSSFWKLFASTPILFFAFIMLTEPITAPPAKWLRIAYGAITGFLLLPSIHIGALYFTPELALVFGNIFSYLMISRGGIVQLFQKKKEIVT